MRTWLCREFRNYSRAHHHTSRCEGDGFKDTRRSSKQCRRKAGTTHILAIEAESETVRYSTSDLPKDCIWKVISYQVLFVGLHLEQNSKCFVTNCYANQDAELKETSARIEMRKKFFPCATSISVCPKIALYKSTKANGMVYTLEFGLVLSQQQMRIRKLISRQMVPQNLIFCTKREKWTQRASDRRFWYGTFFHDIHLRKKWP